MGNVGKVLIAAGALAVVTGALSALHAPSPAPVAETATAADEQRAEETVIAAAKLAVVGTLRDPGSAEFGTVELTNGVVCGFVNARNAFGGYTGMQAFMFGPSVGGLAMQESGGDRFVTTWNAKCASHSPRASKPRRRPH